MNMHNMIKSCIPSLTGDRISKKHGLGRNDRAGVFKLEDFLNMIILINCFRWLIWQFYTHYELRTISGSAPHQPQFHGVC